MPCQGWLWEFGSRASKGENKKANIPHAAAHFMRQDVRCNFITQKPLNLTVTLMNLLVLPREKLALADLK